jgi:hypothetical protein
MSNASPLHQISAQIRKFEKNTIGNVVAIGGLLREAKEQCQHGEYQDWLQREFAWSYRTALRYGYAFDLAQKCNRVTFENLNLSLGALHIAADPGTSDEEQAAIIRAAQEGRITTSIAKTIIDDLRYVDHGDDAGQDHDPAYGNDGDDPQDPKDDAPDHDDVDVDDVDDDVEDDVGDGDPVPGAGGAISLFAARVEDCRTGFMLRADSSITAAKDARYLVAKYKSYSKVPDEEFVQLVDHVLHAWKELRDELSAGRGSIKSAADRAEARSRAVSL